MNNIDVKVRLQKISCSYKDKIAKLSDMMTQGLPCTKDLNEAIIISYFIDMLKCYDFDQIGDIISGSNEGTVFISLLYNAEVNPEFSDFIGQLETNEDNVTSFQLQMNGDVVFTDNKFDTEGNGPAAVWQLLLDQGFIESYNIDVNTHTLEVDCQYSGNTFTLTIGVKMGELVIPYSFDITVPPCSTTTQGIVKEGVDNCLSLDDIRKIFDWLSKKLNVCFAPEGTTYVLPGPITRIISEELNNENPQQTQPAFEDGENILYEPRIIRTKHYKY
jgi:hypothetical protein